MSGFLRVLSALGLLTLWLLLTPSGCRVPDPPILQSPQISIHYDTAWEKTLATSENKPAILDGVFEPYFETLAEPVAVTHWAEMDSTWQIHFATNRGTLDDAADSARIRFGNAVLQSPQFGTADVRLPHHQRGEDPQNPEKTIRRISARSGSDNSEPEPATILTAEKLSVHEFLDGVRKQVDASRQRDVLLFVHGFNVDFDSSLIRTAQLGLDVPFNGALIAYIWPTQGGVLNYESDEPVNAASVRPFAEFLQLLIHSLPKDARLKILVHSMGNRIVLQAINRLPGLTSDARPITTLCACAPDVGLSDYAAWIPGVVRNCERVVMYVNSSDGALKISKSLHLEQRSGDADALATAEGVELIDCSRVDLSFLGHSYFSGNGSVLADLFQVLKENKSAGQRHHLRQERTSAGATYWVFDKHPGRILWTWNF